MSDSEPASPSTRLATGIAGLDDILEGGWTPERMHLVEGSSGSGKTTVALQYVLEGVRQGERCLYVTLSESAEELRAAAASHGWSLDGVELFELLPAEDQLKENGQYTMFHPSEVELSETLRAVLVAVERINPSRVVVDSLSELRLLAQSPFRYRREILALKQFFMGRHVTVLLVDERALDGSDLQVHSLVDGVLSLEQLFPEYGPERRRLSVPKLRGRHYRGGYHDFRIVRGGLEVFPRLVASEHAQPFAAGPFPSGVAALDALLGGGLERGTSALLTGPAGVGKSALAMLYVFAAVTRGEHATFFVFDESVTTLLARSAKLGLDLEPHVAAGRLRIQQIDPAELTAGEFTHVVRQAVERERSRLVIIDSLNGYLNAMPEERFLLIHLHELFSYLGAQGVNTLIVAAQHGVLGSDLQSPVEVSYLVDTVILLRYFESDGEVRQAISVLKQRTSLHERTFRQFYLSEQGIKIGEPLRAFHGIFSGTPTYSGPEAKLLGEADAGA